MEIYLAKEDTLFVFTINKSVYKENVFNLISKMVIIGEFKNISLDGLSETLVNMGINKLNIFVIDYEAPLNTINTSRSDKGSEVVYSEFHPSNFVDTLNLNEYNFFDYNKDTIYILRGGNFLNIKNLFKRISNKNVNVGRGGSQKSHVLSPLDFRLSSYLMAMFNFDYKLISSLNTFNYMDKDRYLSWKDSSIKLSSTTFKPDNIEFKSIKLNSWPLYCKNKDLGKYL